ncbi:MAG: CubicO group peptidase (beta-lactamase class C family) [Halioglobus sp.]|jgi:CubicO group peptidase (beta-lactamase class C family)
MKKLLSSVLWLLLFIVATAALTYYQPWSEFPPSEMNRTFHPDERVNHFRNMDKLYPSKLISKGYTPQPWPAANTALQASYRFNDEERDVADFLERTFTTGLVVIRDGTIVHEQYRLGETASSQHTSWSVAKSFVSTLVGMAVDEGLISSVNDRVDKYIPELVSTAYGAASIKNVLQMSSGVTFYESYGAPGSNTAMAMSDVQKTMFGAWMFDQPVNRLVSDYGKKEAPGERWEYRSSDTQILAWLVETVMQVPFVQLVEERLWEPLGMESNASWLVDGSAEAFPVAFCCLNATLRDYARLGELYRLGGLWNGQRLLSQEWISEATVPDSPHLQPGVVRPERGYQYQWWAPKDYNGEYFASGVWGQNIWVDEKRGVVIARTAVDPNFSLNNAETIAVMRGIVAAVAR